MADGKSRYPKNVAPDLRKDLAERLRQLVDRLGGIQAVAELVGGSSSQVGRWVTGDVTPRVDVVAHLLQKAQWSPWWFLFGGDPDALPPETAAPEAGPPATIATASQPAEAPTVANHLLVAVKELLELATTPNALASADRIRSITAVLRTITRRLEDHATALEKPAE